MNGPCVTVIGAGSFFFGKQVIYKLATSPVFNNGTLNLVDIDPDVLSTMKQVAEQVLDASDNSVQVNGSENYKDVIDGSNFIVLTFSDRNAHFRGIDTEIAAKHGITMCSSDTIGPGGIFRAMREIPKAVEIARYAQEHVPNAWVINFINPTTVLGIALHKYVPDIRSFALCDSLHEPHKSIGLCKQAGIIDDDCDRIPPGIEAGLDLRICGVNHFTWLLKFTYNGKDMTPTLVEDLRESVEKEADEPGEYSKGRFNKAYTYELYNIFGKIPVCIGHTKEYVPYFQGYGQADVTPEPITCFDADRRVKRMADAWEKTEQYASGDLTPEEFLENERSDHASDIMESMWGGLGKPFYVNTCNNGAVTNLPDDAFLEMRSDLDMKSVRPQPVGDMPIGLRGLQQQVLDTHELTADAAVTGNRNILLRAMMSDPIVNNIEDAKNCIEDLLEAEQDALPEYWY